MKHNSKTMSYDTKEEKQQRVEQILANIPVGTKYVEYYNGFNKRKVSEGVVIGHTKSGNIKLESNGGFRMKTAYHFQKLSKQRRDGRPRKFDVAGRYRHFVEFS